LVGVFALAADSVGEALVLVPAHVEELDEAHAAFGEAAGEEAVGGVGAALGDIGAVEIEDFFGFFGEVGELGDGGLHLVGELGLRDAGGDLGVSR